MTPALTPYPTYKDSGVPWLSDVPAHWEMERGKWLFERMQRSVRSTDETVTCFRDGMVTLRKNRRTSGFTESLKEIGYQGVRRGDLVIHAMDAFAGAIGVSDSDGKCTPVYAVCRPKRPLNTHFYAYIVREMSRTQYIVALSRGIRQRSTDFRFDAFANQILPVPSFTEQEKIAAFLLHYERVTRRYIRAQRRLIELLTEQKQALIQQAVTSGLDPDVPLKDSGVEWLGKIPTHWEVRKLKYCARINPSKSESVKSFEDNETVTFLPMEKVSENGEIDCSEQRPIQDVWSGFTYFRRDDVVIAKITPCFENGKGAYLNDLATQIGFGTTEFIVLRANEFISPAYLYQVTMTPLFRIHGAEAMTGAAGQQRVPIDFVREFMIPLPPREEQEKILTHIDNRLETIDQGIHTAQRQVALVREYRTRLIADVVTGKLDVRGVELPTDETLDDLGDVDEFDVVEDNEDADLNGLDEQEV